ncbi:MAG: hypothetical protein ACE5JA_02735 [bacterium]
MGQIAGLWVAAFLTLSIFSFLYKDNPFYKFAEHLFVGVSAGYWLAYYYHNVVIPNLCDPLRRGDYLYIIPAVLGVMMLMRLAPKIGWISRWALAFIIGMGAGYYLITYLQTNAVAQVHATMMLRLDNINSILLVLGILTGLIYFFFSKEHRGILGGAAKVGIYFLMVAFGASFGYTVMARFSLLIGRMHFLIFQWLPTIPFLKGLGG